MDRRPPHILSMPQARKKSAPHRRAIAPTRSGPSKPPARIAVTVRLDPDRAVRFRDIATIENRSLANYVEAVLLRELARREEADRIITMYAAPDAPDSIRPEDVVRAAGESDEEYAARQTLAVELWSIPHNAGGGLSFLDDEPDLYSDADAIERYR
jgi:hypothetical protein